MGQGPDVAFVPGFMQRGEAWRAVAERVGTRYRSTCLDPAAATFEARLGEIVAAAPRRSALVGYSMGGRLALHAVLRHPRRFAALVLVGTSAGIDDEAERDARRGADEELAGWMERRPIEEVVARWESSPVLATQSEALRVSQRPGRLAHDPRELASLLRTAGQGALAPVWEGLRDVPCPVLAVAGEEDAPYVEAARRIAALVPRGEVRCIAGTGHAPQLEAPEAFASALLEFLDEHLGHGGLVRGHAEPRPRGHG